MIFTLALLLSLQPAALAGTVEAAEHQRLQEEMQKLATRNAWTGVERNFEALLELEAKGEALEFDDYYLAAQAAQAMGDMTACRNRLELAQRLEPSDEVDNWLANINLNYSFVKISFERSVKEHALAREAMPFAPEQRKTIEVAQVRLEENRAYDGLLPVGESKVTIHLTPDAAVSTRSSEGFSFSYVGPRAQLGPSYTVAGSPDATQAPPSFSGLGARAGAGLEVGLGIRFGAMVEVGYHNLINPDSDTGYGDNLHLGYGLIGPAYRAGDFWLSLGGIFAVGVSKASGINGLDSVNSDCPFGTDNPDCAWVASVPEEDRDAYPWAGNVRSAGAQASVSYALLDIGKSLAGAASLQGGFLSDGSRSYPWGQLAFTIAPVPSRSE